MAIKVPEKTLEINVCSDMLQRIRQYASRAYVFGYHTRQEGEHGLDVSFRVPRFRFMLGLQFKAPTSRRGDIYVFRVGDRARKGCYNLTSPIRDPCINQHVALLKTAITVYKALQRWPPPVYYVFPLIYDNHELEQYSTSMLRRTIFMRVTDFPLHTFLDCQPHRVEIDSTSMTAIVRSREPSTVEVKTADEVLEELKDILKECKPVDGPIEFDIPVSEIREFLEELLSKLPEEKRKELAKNIDKIVKQQYRYQLRTIVIV